VRVVSELVPSIPASLPITSPLNWLCTSSTRFIILSSLMPANMRCSAYLIDRILDLEFYDDVCDSSLLIVSPCAVECRRCGCLWGVPERLNGRVNSVPWRLFSVHVHNNAVHVCLQSTSSGRRWTPAVGRGVVRDTGLTPSHLLTGPSHHTRAIAVY